MSARRDPLVASKVRMAGARQRVDRRIDMSLPNCLEHGLRVLTGIAAQAARAAARSTGCETSVRTRERVTTASARRGLRLVRLVRARQRRPDRQPAGGEAASSHRLGEILGPVEQCRQRGRPPEWIRQQRSTERGPLFIPPLAVAVQPFEAVEWRVPVGQAQFGARRIGMRRD